MKFWFKWIRWVILGGAVLFGISLYLLARQRFDFPTLIAIQLTRWYAFSALVFLYSALIYSPLYAAFPKLPGRVLYLRARRALGVSAFVFAASHASFAFFGTLGGFAGWGFLSGRYMLAILMSLTALTILTAMTITSLDYAVRKMGKYWKQLHRFVYLAGVLIVVHAFLLGSDFLHVFGFVPIFWFVLLVALLFLEALRLDQYILRARTGSRTYSLGFVVSIALIAVLIFYYFFHAAHGGGLHVH